MSENIERFLKKMAEDPALGRRVTEVASAESGSKLAETLATLGRAAGCEFTARELIDYAPSLVRSKELSDELLAGVSGGGNIVMDTMTAMMTMQQKLMKAATGG